MIIGFVGFRGSGKTLLMVFFAYLLYLSGKKIFSNIKLFFPYEEINPMDIVTLSPKLENAVILLDEIHMLADSRVSGGKQNRYISYFALQSRHRNCDILYTTQQDKQAEKRIRETCDLKVICENMHIDSDKDGHNDIFRIVIQDRRNHPYRITEREIYGKPVFDLYDTHQIVNPFDMKEIAKAMKGLKTSSDKSKCKTETLPNQECDHIIKLNSNPMTWTCGKNVTPPRCGFDTQLKKWVQIAQCPDFKACKKKNSIAEVILDTVNKNDKTTKRKTSTKEN